MTEAEAKTKWCPFARGDSIARERIISRKPQESHNRCIASACMAWRGTDSEPRNPADPSSNYLSAGFCGLAGKP